MRPDATSSSLSPSHLTRGCTQVNMTNIKQTREGLNECMLLEFSPLLAVGPQVCSINSFLMWFLNFQILPHTPGNSTLIVPYQNIIPKNIHASNIIWIGPVIFRNIKVYLYVHTIAIGEKRGHKLEEEWGGVSRRV